MAWETKTLGEVCKIIRGSSPRPIKDYITEDIDGENWIKIGDAGEDEKYFTQTKQKITKKGAECSRLVNVGDFIFSNSMSYGRAYIMKIKGYIHDGWFSFEVPNYINKEFLWYLFKTNNLKQQFDDLSGGAVVKNISSDLIKKAKISYPTSLTEQEAIVSYLDDTFEKIEQCKENIKQNIINAKELFQSKLNLIFKGKKHWETKTLGEVSTINYGYTAKANFEDIGIKYLRITDITEKGVDWESVPSCEISSKEINKFLLEKGDIVFARTGATTGKSFLFDDEIKSVFASYLIRLKVNNKENLLPNLVYYYFQSGMYWDEINKGIVGAAQGGFNAKKLSLLTLSFPSSLTEQEAIVKELDELSLQVEELVNKYQQKLQLLQELKSSILEQVFTPKN